MEPRSQPHPSQWEVPESSDHNVLQAKAKAWCKQTTWELRNLLAAGQRTYLMLKSCGGYPLGVRLPTLCWGDASCLTILKIG